jgi:hypothetical protein
MSHLEKNHGVAAAAATAKKSGGRSELVHALPIPSQGGPSVHGSDESLRLFWVGLWMGESEPRFPFSSLMWLSECIIYTFVRDIRDKDMKSDINIRKQTASKLEPRDGNVLTSIVVQNLTQFFPRKKRQTSIMFVWFLKPMAHLFN